MAVDPRATGRTPASATWCRKRKKTYRNVFVIHFPDEERADARPAKTSPVYDKLARMGRGVRQRYGWERANWFAPPGVPARTNGSFRRSNTRARGATRRCVCENTSESSTSRRSPKHEVTDRVRRAGWMAWWPTKCRQDRPDCALPCPHRRGGIRSRIHHHQDRDQHFLCGGARRRRRYDSHIIPAVACPGRQV